MEIQVLDDPAPVYEGIQPAQYCGSIYDGFTAKQGAPKPTGERNLGASGQVPGRQ